MALETDDEGLVINRPVLGWTTALAAGIAVILQIDYAETPAEIETGGRSLQVTLMPPQALELAQVLAEKAKLALNAPPSAGH